MPHLRLEHTEAVTPDTLQALFDELHQLLHRTAGIDLGNCKSRASRVDCYRVGDGHSDQGFVHLWLQVLDGRDEALLRQIGQGALEALKRAFPAPNLQRTVEVGEIPRARYFKG